MDFAIWRKNHGALKTITVLSTLLWLSPVTTNAAPGGPPQDPLSSAIERLNEDGRTRMLLGTPYLTDPSSLPPTQIALDFIEAHASRFGLNRRQLSQLVVTRSYRTEHNGVQQLTLGQEIRGYRVLNSGLTFSIDALGRVISVGGEVALGAPTGAAALNARAGLQRAAQAAGVGLPLWLAELPSNGNQLRFENTFARVLHPNPVTAEQVWYPSEHGNRLVLAWQVEFEVDGELWLRSVVDADSGAVLHEENLYVHAGPGGTVFTGQHPEDSPAEADTPFTGIDGSWVTGRVTSGNNVNAYRDLADDDVVGYQPQTPDVGDPAYQHFNYLWTDDWRSSGDGSDDSLDADLDFVITQLFYYTNVMHDWLYGYGFDEASGNFQVDNFGKGGSGGDPVLAEAQDGWDFGCENGTIRCSNNANFATPGDGTSPRMQMYMWSPNRPYGDGSVDGDVIAHEYGHGVSSRLVGGGNLGYGANLVHASLGEGWSDIISFLKWGDNTVGEYVTGNAATGIRSVAYDASNLMYSDYDPWAGSGHPNGEIWASMVYDIRAELGVNTTTQLVIDGMKATPALPDYLDARDAIIAADTANNAGANFCLLWRIFAERGLGLNATFNKYANSGPTDNFDVPVTCAPTADAGGTYNTDEGTDVVLDGSGSTESDDSSGGAIVSYEWDLDNDGEFDDATGVSPTFTDVGDNEVQTIGLRVTNAAGFSDEASTTVTIENVDPVVSPNAVTGTSENTAITLSGSIADAGWLDVITATVDWGDGNGVQALAGTLENVRPDATFSFSLEHTYGDNGTYTIEVCGNDDDGGSHCATVNVTISNTDPTTALDSDFYLAHAGESVDVSGGTTDPGSDDLSATWTWGDGTSDAETSLVNPPATDPAMSPSIQPRDVSWSASHIYADACLYTLELGVTDDDAGTSSDTATVIITGNDDSIWGSGWWLNQYRPQPPNTFTNAQLECYLDIVRTMSDVFDEDNSPLDTRQDAVKVLFVNKNRGTANELFDEQLLAAWLNFANGGYDLDSPVDTDGDGATDSTFEAAVAAAEAVRLDGAATRAELLLHKGILERIVQAQKI
ncbi:M36 family metallopeptidase [Marinobacterium rhizophilum]|uniref:M36 family metallopeptidase n=1 Tax=Marinobacterium rhizophilum TaxID=420402 RepID=UPI000368E063|nr:M36 family metallopeptidase [Marinobacterium rhizophilum]